MTDNVGRYVTSSEADVQTYRFGLLNGLPEAEGFAARHTKIVANVEAYLDPLLDPANIDDELFNSALKDRSILPFSDVARIFISVHPTPSPCLGPSHRGLAPKSTPPVPCSRHAPRTMQWSWDRAGCL